MTYAPDFFTGPFGGASRFQVRADSPDVWQVIDRTTAHLVAVFTATKHRTRAETRDAAVDNAWDHDVRASRAETIYGAAPAVAQVALDESSGSVDIFAIGMNHAGGPVHAAATHLLGPAPARPRTDVETDLETHGWRVITRARAAWALLAAGYALTTTPHDGYVLHHQDADATTWNRNPGAPTTAFVARIPYGVRSGGWQGQIGDATIATYPRNDQPDSDDASDLYVVTVFGITLTINLILDPPAASTDTTAPCVHPYIHIDADGREPSRLVAKFGHGNPPVEHHL